jgi:hypothetical protein
MHQVECDACTDCYVLNQKVECDESTEWNVLNQNVECDESTEWRVLNQKVESPESDCLKWNVENALDAQSGDNMRRR